MVRLMPVRGAAEPSAPKHEKKAQFKSTAVTIYGTLLPAPIVTKGKYRGAAIAAGGIVWLLDLTAVKGFDAYAQQLLQKPVAVFGTTTITKEKDGSLSRKIQVGWMEPLNGITIAPPGVTITPINGRPRVVPGPPR